MKKLTFTSSFSNLVKTFSVGALLLLTSFSAVTFASHSWGKYHWDKSTEDTLTSPLLLGANLSTDWDTSLTIASGDWSLSVLKTQITSGQSNSNCDPTSGRVEVCNGAYGENGWLGIASIWATRGKSNHITQGVVKLNDTYFDQPGYSSDAWKNFVMCQEVGHTFGLGHQDEAFTNANLGTCMDYTDDPDGTLYGQLDNQHPNQHDYDEMESIYAHLNSTDGGDNGGSGNGKGRGKPKKANAPLDLNNPTEWGTAVKQDALGRNSVYERVLTNGQILITHVLWAE